MIAAEYNGVIFTATELPRKMALDSQCARCEFAKMNADQCRQVCKIATAAGLPDCDIPGPRGKPVIYVDCSGDPRQGDLVGAV